MGRVWNGNDTVECASPVMFRTVVVGFCMMLLFAVPPLVRAQEIDTNGLQYLYERLLQEPENAYIKQRITAEREKIRTIVERELQQTLETAEEESESGEISNALDRQRQLITGLRERLQERNADLDILIAEEEQYYLTPSGDAASTDDSFRLTKTHSELLARKAVIEERQAALEAFIALQDSRLQKLERDQLLHQFGIFITIGKYALIFFLVWLFVRLVRSMIYARVGDVARRYRISKVFAFVVYSVAVVWLLTVIISKQPGILASLAIVGAGLAISLQDIVKDLIGWVVIHQRGLFTQGNRVAIGTRIGEIMDIGLLHTRMLEIGVPPDSVLEQTGKLVTIPNHMVLTQPVTNFHATSDFVKAEMRFVITYESDWRKAQEIVSEILEQEAAPFTEQEKHQYSLRTRLLYTPYEPGGPQIFIDLAADGVLFTLRFTTPVGMQRNVISRITDRILEGFHAEPTVHLAYTTRRIIAG